MFMKCTIFYYIIVCIILNTLPLSSHRLIKGGATPNSQNFTFINTTYTDDKTIFTCVGNTLDESEDTEMGVLCKPSYMYIMHLTQFIYMYMYTCLAYICLFKHNKIKGVHKLMYMYSYLL